MGGILRVSQPTSPPLTNPASFHKPLIPPSPEEIKFFLSSPIYREALSLINDASVPISTKEQFALENFNIHLKHHTKAVTSLFISINEEILLSSSIDNTVKMWDLKSRKQIAAFLHLSKVNQVLITPDNLSIVSLCDLKDIYVWNSMNHQLIHKFSDFNFRIGSIQISPCGKNIYLGCGNAPGQTTCPIRVISLISGEELNSYYGHQASANNIIFIDPSSFLSCSGGQSVITDDNSVRLWNTSSQTYLKSYKDFLGFVKSIVISHKLQQVLAGSKDHTIHVLTLTLSRLHVLRGHESSVESLAMTKDDEFLISGSLDSTVRVWDLKKKWVLRVFNHSTVLCVVSAGKFIISGSMCVIKLNDMANKETELPGHYGEIEWMSITPGSHFLVSAASSRNGRDGMVRVWNLLTGEQEYFLNYPSGFSLADTTDDGQGLLITLADGKKKGFSARRSKRWVEHSRAFDFLLLSKRKIKLK